MFQIVLIIFVLYHFLLIITTNITFLLEKIYMNKIKKVTTNIYPNIYVLLPALEEQKILYETMEWFSNLAYDGTIKFYIITTEKENYLYDKNNITKKTTSTLVNEYKNKFDKFKIFEHLHYPNINGNKSSQLNFAIKHISTIEKNKANSYISIFDFDSRPDINTFINLSKVASLKNNPAVIQQVPLNLYNINDLNTNWKNSLLILANLHQLIRAYGIEKYRLLITSLFSIPQPLYCMGASMHINLLTLNENEFIPDIVDDLTLGYKYTIKNLKFAYLPNINYGYIPNKVKDYINSSVLVFRGVLTSFTEVFKTKGKLKYKFIILLEGLINVLMITIIPYLFILYLILSINQNSFNLLFWAIFIIPYLWTLQSFMIIFKHKVNINNTIKLNALVLSPIWFFYRTFGSIIFITRSIKSFFSTSPITYKKTER